MTAETTAAQGVLKLLSERIPEGHRELVLAALRVNRELILDQAVSEGAPEAEIDPKPILRSWDPLKAEIAAALGKEAYNLPRPVSSFFGTLTVSSRTEIDALLEETDSES